MTSRDLPVGTVTFVFTDIEGSTRLVLDLGEAFPPVLERHNDLVLGAVKENQGLMVKNEGDGFSLRFSRRSTPFTARLTSNGRLRPSPGQRRGR